MNSNQISSKHLPSSSLTLHWNRIRWPILPCWCRREAGNQLRSRSFENGVWWCCTSEVLGLDFGHLPICEEHIVACRLHVEGESHSATAIKCRTLHKSLHIHLGAQRNLCDFCGQVRRPGGARKLGCHGRCWTSRLRFLQQALTKHAMRHGTNGSIIVCCIAASFYVDECVSYPKRRMRLKWNALTVWRWRRAQNYGWWLWCVAPGGLARLTTSLFRRFPQGLLR